MKENLSDPDRIRAFDPVLAELSTHHRRNEIYQKHLKDLRLFLWVALIIFSILFYWYGETNRYTHAKDYFILDTKTGWMYDTNGKRVDK